MDTSEDERQQKRGKWVLTRHTMPMQQSIRDTWDERHRGQWGATKSLRRRTMKRQTITQWRWWWVMTTVTRNNERQGQRVWGERILCTTQKMTMTMREQQQSTITINNHNQQSIQGQRQWQEMTTRTREKDKWWQGGRPGKRGRRVRGT